MSECKKNLTLGILAHVHASRRAPRKNSCVPGPETGDFSCLAEVKLFQGLKTPPYFVALTEQKPQHITADFRASDLWPFSAL